MILHRLHGPARSPLRVTSAIGLLALASAAPCARAQDLPATRTPAASSQNASLTGDEEVPSDPELLLGWVAKRWSATGWTHPDTKQGYLRDLSDAGWRARLLALRRSAELGASAAPALVDALQHADEELRIFAAQALGYLSEHAPEEALLRAAGEDASAAVRLYAVDALASRGASEVARQALTALVEAEKNRDVKHHLRYALERGGEPSPAKLRSDLASLDPKTLGTAIVGSPAPAFELESYGGEKIRLEDFRGKSPVVLVFLYGDT